jgi:hypothetical protein
VTYREALAALQDAYLTILDIIATTQHLPEALERLQLLADRLERLLARDNGRLR